MRPSGYHACAPGVVAAPHTIEIWGTVPESLTVDLDRARRAQDAAVYG